MEQKTISSSLITVSISLILTVTASLFIGCISNDSRTGRPQILSELETTGDEDCPYIVVNDTGCYTGCPSGTHVATQDEIDKAGISAEEQTRVDNFIADKTLSNVCIADSTRVSRPTGQIFVKSNYCSCLNGKADIINNCDSYCSSKTVDTPTLYGSVTLGADVELNEDLGNLYNWCNKEINDGKTSPSCFLIIYDGQATSSIAVTVPGGANSFTVNLLGLAKNKTYVAYLQESTSRAKSSSFQLRRIDPVDTTEEMTGPLKIMPVSQYTCITRAGGEEAGSDIFENAARLHFYYPSNNAPLPLPAGDNFNFCHDINLYGENDSSLFPRLELIPQSFAVWDMTDIRFYDLDSSGKLDVNELIESRLAKEYDINKTINIFAQFSWPNRPSTEESSTPPVVGFYMQPWINQTTGRGFCPTQTHYNDTGPSADPTFRVLRDIIGVNTEGLYLSIKEPEMLKDSEGTLTEAPQDILLIRESLLKKIWFYYENRQHYVPNEITAAQKTIMFYYPADPIDPYIKKSTQRIYTVKSPETIGQSDAVEGLRTTIRPPDKRFGCVPALD